MSRLRAQGVQEASFHPDGKLASVSFAGVMPPVLDEEEQDEKRRKVTPAHISAAREAFRVLNGSRQELDEA